MVHFGEFLKSFILRSNSVTRQVNFYKDKIGEKCQIETSNMTLWVDKSSLKMPKKVNLASFRKPEICSQTVLPDRSIF